MQTRLKLPLSGEEGVELGGVLEHPQLPSSNVHGHRQSRFSSER